MDELSGNAFNRLKIIRMDSRDSPIGRDRDTNIKKLPIIWAIQ
jgi:hypothetical protein